MYRPFYKVEAEGEEFTDKLADHLIELRLNDRSGEHADSLDLELADEPRFQWPREGAEMAVRLGYEGERPRAAQHFAIDQIEHTGPPAHFTVSATSIDFTSQMRAPRERSFRTRSIGELVREIAGEHGYEAKVEPEALADVQLIHVDQGGESDIELIYGIAKQYGALFKVVDGKWWLRSYDALGAPAHVIRPGDVSTWRAHFIARRKLASVTAHYQDFAAALRVPVTVGEGQPNKVLDGIFVDENTARAAALAELGRARRRSRTLTLRMPGRPDIASQQVLTLADFRDGVNADWLVTEVIHTISKRGYSCRVDCEGV